MKLNKSEGQILHLGRGSCEYMYRLGDERLEKKGFGDVVNDKLNMCQKS